MDLVTGGAGFIGSHLVDSLVAQGKSVRVLDNFSSGREEFLAHHKSTTNVEIFRADLLDPESVKNAMQGINTVHHLAANPDIRLGTEVTDTDLRQGTVATYNVLEAMRCEGVSRISFASSSAIYGEASIMPTPETYGPVKPISLYGASKLASEALITAWCGTFGAKAWVHRFANIVGPRGTHGVIFDFIHKLKNDPTRLEVLGNGLQEKSYMSAEDCVRAMVYLVGNTSEDVNLYNLGTGDTCSVRRIAEIVVEESGLEGVSIEYTGGDRGWAGDVPKTSLDVEYLLSTGFVPEMQSEAAIRHTARALIDEIGL
ncbi:MAG: UDP-glucose 4-epimerase [Marine Group II euryarchaeote MED-G36]|nr:MAG: UDP-glucose 4-epimerase [Marine Group II euryarchaeote MED-G36]